MKGRDRGYYRHQRRRVIARRTRRFKEIRSWAIEWIDKNQSRFAKYNGCCDCWHCKNSQSDTAYSRRRERRFLRREFHEFLNDEGRTVHGVRLG